MDERQTVSLYTADGRELRFEQVADIRLAGARYAVLAPLDEAPGLGRGQALVFSVSEGSGDRAALNIVTDAGIIEAVFEEYRALMERKFEERAQRGEPDALVYGD